MIFILSTIIFSYVYIILRKLIPSPTLLDMVFPPVIYWTISLASVEIFIVISPFGVAAGVPMLMLMWQIISTWIDYVSEQSGNKKLKEDKDKFKDLLLAPVNAIVAVWNAIVNGLSSWFRVVSEYWNNMTKMYIDMLNLISNSFKFLSDQVTKLWFELIKAYKALWNQSIKLADLAVTMGGTIDEDIAPPLPEKFEEEVVEKKVTATAQQVTATAQQISKNLNRNFFRR